MLAKAGKLVGSGLLVFVYGCGSAGSFGEGQPNLVRGSISFANNQFNIEAADGATVQFHPKNGGSSEKKIAGVLSDGVFRISTEADGEVIGGAEEGEYLVTITPAAANSGTYSPQVIPKKYNDPKTTDLTVQVGPGDNRLAPFELKP